MKLGFPKALLFVASLILAVACAHTPPRQPADACLQKRAAFDVGSASTRVLAALVNTCKRQIVSVLAQEEEKVNYKEDLTKSSDKNFSTNVETLGLGALDRLRAVVLRAGVEPGEMRGVATSAFRDAKNGQAFTDEINQKLGIGLRIISQDDEGILGFYSGLSATQGLRERTAVWDIGGGSMQITIPDGEIFHVFKGNLAAVSFKNRVLKEIEKSDKTSPNPLLNEDLKKAVALALADAQKNVDPRTREALKSPNSRLQLLGIGGVWGASILNQLKVSSGYVTTEAEIERLLYQKAGKTDAEIGNDFAATEVTNLALVVGYMKALQIDEITLVAVNNAQGILIGPDYWSK